MSILSYETLEISRAGAVATLSQDHREGVEALAEKRPAAFTGS